MPNKTWLFLLFIILAFLTFAFLREIVAKENAGPVKVPVVSAKASSFEKEEFSPGKAIDGNLSTRWSSAFSDPQWIYIDFGKPKTFNVITLDWEAAYGKAYEIQISNNAADWTAIYAKTDGAGEKDVIYFKKQTARYVRMYGTQRGTKWGYSLCEFKAELNEDTTPPAVPANLSATPGEGVMFLTWDGKPEADLRGYNIYRAKNPQGPYEKLNSEPLKISKFKDKNLALGTTCYYTIKAMDYFGNESPLSKTVSGTPSSRKTGEYFSIPGCAWRRYLGDLPEGAVSCSVNRGVALGGFGAGSFMYNISGSFGPWELKICDSRFEQFWKPLSQAAFHYYEKRKEGDHPVIKCLSTEKSLKPAWKKIKTGEAEYYALQPKGWVVFNSFDVKIKSLFYSPIIANNYKETSYPVAVFEYELYNPTNEKIEASLMLTWPQVPYSVLPRNGYQSNLMKKKEISGIVLKAVDPKNTAETQNSEWCIATKKIKGDEIVSYVLSWNKDGDGKDIWNDFAGDGILSGKSLDLSNSAAAIAVKVTLDPLERRRIPFVISWDIPVIEFASGTQWWRKYTEYFGRTSDNSFNIAVEALNNYQGWEADIDAWMAPFVNNPKYPDWLKCAAFNELYYNQFGGVFYESGLKSGQPQEFMGLHPEDHKHFVMESPIYRSANTLDVRHYSSIDFAKGHVKMLCRRRALL
jgi:hypothetical protein